MAEGKNSFILYCDQRGMWNHLTDEQAGRLIKHIFAFVNDENPTADFITELAFQGIKSAMLRDLEKYKQIRLDRVEAGRAGGRADRKQNQAKPSKTKQTQAKPSKRKQTQANEAVNVNVNVNDSVNVNVNEKKEKKATPIYFQDPDLNDVFSKWIIMCREKGKPFVQTSIEAMCMKLNYLSTSDAVAQINQSLENCWLNLRPIEQINGKAHTKTEPKMIDRSWD